MDSKVTFVFFSDSLQIFELGLRLADQFLIKCHCGEEQYFSKVLSANVHHLLCCKTFNLDLHGAPVAIVNKVVSARPK